MTQTADNAAILQQGTGDTDSAQEPRRNRFKYGSILLSFLLLSLVLTYTLPPLLPPLIHHAPPPWYEEASDIDRTDSYYSQPESTYRSELSDTAAIVRFWPSTGGLLLREHATGIEVDFLGLDRFDNVPRPSPYNATLEDDFCERLERLGATHCEDESDYFGSMMHRTRRYRALLAWPENDTGGTWALVLSAKEWRRTACVHNARTMEERGEMIRRLGGRYFGDWTELRPKLRKALKADRSPGLGPVEGFEDILAEPVPLDTEPS
ncbi:hypothetical protein C1H76_3384 [Elsinoe australis]|uniref:Uncharacterized protein n=1 Tax=Elsinoe australis TaxID=40998 RepID=A0A4V6DUF2_9PEZI|nr:hypothetical protein C1H76_3384 [Elsinoe australis]